MAQGDVGGDTGSGTTPTTTPPGTEAVDICKGLERMRLHARVKNNCRQGNECFDCAANRQANEEKIEELASLLDSKDRDLRKHAASELVKVAAWYHRAPKVRDAASWYKRGLWGMRPVDVENSGLAILTRQNQRQLASYVVFRLRAPLEHSPEATQELRDLIDASCTLCLLHGGIPKNDARWLAFIENPSEKDHHKVEHKLSNLKRSLHEALGSDYMQGAVSALCCSAEASESLQETIDQMCKFVCKGPIGEEEGFPGIQEAADRVKNFPNQRTIYDTVKNVYLPAECLAFMWVVALCLQTDLMDDTSLPEWYTIHAHPALTLMFLSHNHVLSEAAADSALVLMRDSRKMPQAFKDDLLLLCRLAISRKEGGGVFAAFWEYVGGPISESGDTASPVPPGLPLLLKQWPSLSGLDQWVLRGAASLIWYALASRDKQQRLLGAQCIVPYVNSVRAHMQGDRRLVETSLALLSKECTQSQLSECCLPDQGSNIPRGLPLPKLGVFLLAAAFSSNDKDTYPLLGCLLPMLFGGLKQQQLGSEEGKKIAVQSLTELLDLNVASVLPGIAGAVWWLCSETEGLSSYHTDLLKLCTELLSRVPSNELAPAMADAHFVMAPTLAAALMLLDQSKVEPPSPEAVLDFVKQLPHAPNVCKNEKDIAANRCQLQLVSQIAVKAMALYRSEVGNDLANVLAAYLRHFQQHPDYDDAYLSAAKHLKALQTASGRPLLTGRGNSMPSTPQGPRSLSSTPAVSLADMETPSINENPQPTAPQQTSQSDDDLGLARNAVDLWEEALERLSKNDQASTSADVWADKLSTGTLYSSFAPLSMAQWGSCHPHHGTYEIASSFGAGVKSLGEGVDMRKLVQTILVDLCLVKGEMEEEEKGTSRQVVGFQILSPQQSLGAHLLSSVVKQNLLPVSRVSTVACMLVMSLNSKTSESPLLKMVGACKEEGKEGEGEKEASIGDYLNANMKLLEACLSRCTLNQLVNTKWHQTITRPSLVCACLHSAGACEALLRTATLLVQNSEQEHGGPPCLDWLRLLACHSLCLAALDPTTITATLTLASTPIRQT